VMPVRAGSVMPISASAYLACDDIVELRARIIARVLLGECPAIAGGAAIGRVEHGITLSGRDLPRL